MLPKKRVEFENKSHPQFILLLRRLHQMMLFLRVHSIISGM